MFPIPLVFTASAAVGAADPLWEFTTPHGLTITAVSLCGQAFTGTPTSWNVDVAADGTDILSAVASQTTAGTPGLWTSRHLGGTTESVVVAAGSVVGITLNAVGGSSPTVSKLAVVVWALPGAM